MTLQSRCCWFLILAAITASVEYVTCCKAGYWGENCTNRCNSTCYNRLGCSPTDGKCNRCERRSWGAYCEKTCNTNCRKCHQTDGSCLSCDNGYWGPSCDKECNTHCEKCNKADGNCWRCDAGYWGSSCDTECNNTCYLCYKANGSCLMCDDGYWGPSCDKECNDTCENCNKADGRCDKCIKGNWGEYCENECSYSRPNCENCEKENGACIECKPGYWGYNCEDTCSIGCANECAKSNGSCPSCLSGFWGERCTNICNNEPRCEQCYDNIFNLDKDYFCKIEKRIERCNPRCECDKIGGKCLKCIGDLWGKHCNNTCPLHCAEPSCGGHNGTCKGCKKGYWGELCNIPCDSVDSCKHVNLNCSQTTGRCQNCINGFWGKFCDKKCPFDCLEASCERWTGACEGCKDGFWGENCTQCSSACTGSMCHKVTGYCNECKEGYWGHNCTSTCGDKCQTCSMNTGKCKTCVDMFWGTECNMNCSKNCITCLNDSHCTSCIDGYYGVNQCNETCPSKCFEGKCTLYGECYLGCNVGYSGKTCDRPCNANCLVVNTTTSCSHDDGTCLHGCNPGFTNEFCSQVRVFEPVRDIVERKTEDGTQQRNVIIGVSVTLSVMLSIVAVTTIVYCTKRRRSHRRQPVAVELPAASVPIQLQNIRPVSEDHVYAYILDPQDEQAPETAATVLGGISGPYTHLKKNRDEDRDGQNTTEAILPDLGDHVPNTSTDDTETTSAYLTAVNQQPVVGEEHGATAGWGPLGRNTDTTKNEYVEGRVNTMPSWSTTEADIPVHGDQESNTSTDDTETTSAYLIAVYQQQVVGEEHGATAGLDPLGRNTETTNHEYVEVDYTHMARNQRVNEITENTPNYRLDTGTIV